MLVAPGNIIDTWQFFHFYFWGGGNTHHVQTLQETCIPKLFVSCVWTRYIHLHVLCELSWFPPCRSHRTLKP